MIERVFQADHPALQGHYPGNPVVPGAILLSETLQAIEVGLGTSLAPFTIVSAKFLHPARPGDRVRIDYSGDAGGEIRFTCAVEGRAVLTGRLTCRAR